MNEESNVFINEGFDYAITMYLKYKDRPYSPVFNSFLVVVVRMLAIIYGHEVVEYTYIAHREAGLDGFDENVMRYDYSEDKLKEFKARVQRFYEWAKSASEKEENGEDAGKPEEFVLIQKDLVDMMITKMKRANVSDEEKRLFESLMFTPVNNNPSYRLMNLKLATDPEEVKYYWLNEQYKKDHVITFEVLKQNVLNPIVYEAMGHTLEEILNMSQEEINQMNDSAFKRFEIDANEEGKFEKLNAAAEEFLNRKPPITSGSGFVDGLLLVSIMATLTSVGYILAALFLR